MNRENPNQKLVLAKNQIFHMLIFLLFQRKHSRVCIFPWNTHFRKKITKNKKKKRNHTTFVASEMFGFLEMKHTAVSSYREAHGVFQVSSESTRLPCSQKNPLQ